MTSVPSLNKIGRKFAKLAHREFFSKNRDLAGWAVCMGKIGLKIRILREKSFRLICWT